MMEKEELYARVETTESFSIKLEQILPWQDGQYAEVFLGIRDYDCLLYTSPSPRDMRRSRMPSSA